MFVKNLPVIWNGAVYYVNAMADAMTNAIYNGMHNSINNAIYNAKDNAMHNAQLPRYVRKPQALMHANCDNQIIYLHQGKFLRKSYSSVDHSRVDSEMPL